MTRIARQFRSVRNDTEVGVHHSALPKPKLVGSLVIGISLLFYPRSLGSGPFVVRSFLFMFFSVALLWCMVLGSIFSELFSSIIFYLDSWMISCPGKAILKLLFLPRPPALLWGCYCIVQGQTGSISFLGTSSFCLQDCPFFFSLSLDSETLAYACVCLFLLLIYGAGWPLLPLLRLSFVLSYQDVALKPHILSLMVSIFSYSALCFVISWAWSSASVVQESLCALAGVAQLERCPGL